MIKETYLEHVAAHGVAEFMLEGLVFKVKFDFIRLNTFHGVIVLNYVKENLDSTFCNGLLLLRLRKFYLKPILMHLIKICWILLAWPIEDVQYTLKD